MDHGDLVVGVSHGEGSAKHVDTVRYFLLAHGSLQLVASRVVVLGLAALCAHGGVGMGSFTSVGELVEGSTLAASCVSVGLGKPNVIILR